MSSKFITTEEKIKIEKLNKISNILNFLFAMSLNILTHVNFKKELAIVLIILSYILAYIGYKLELKQFIVKTERVKKWTFAYFVINIIFSHLVIIALLFIEKEDPNFYIPISIIAILVIINIVYSKVFKNNEYNNLKINLEEI
ncbi:hypothetical protein [Gemelliphila palaticanis]|uniref:Uncharacterized protein n=1 Tax=Gemelliphila palaticanis TaxID=81950 RepID=A0ABX2SZC1_9BACL|nr:hypothetical protein [Gemella palaticanis]MBF0715699.1 hypothetical protein [Gemella palaticanis]NYS47629.1 hypothetical protein [Gemella palaticanis]